MNWVGRPRSLLGYSPGAKGWDHSAVSQTTPKRHGGFPFRAVPMLPDPASTPGGGMLPGDFHLDRGMLPRYKGENLLGMSI